MSARPLYSVKASLREDVRVLAEALERALPYVESYARLHPNSNDDIVAAATAARAALAKLREVGK